MQHASGLGNRLTHLLAVVTLPVAILAYMFFGLQATLAVFVVGWLLLVPASTVLFGPAWASNSDPVESLNTVREMQSVADDIRSNRDDAGQPKPDPLDRLRDRYASGDIDEAEFERRLEGLLETEDTDPADQEAVERAVERLDPDDAVGEVDGTEPANRNTSRDRDLEPE